MKYRKHKLKYDGRYKFRLLTLLFEQRHSDKANSDIELLVERGI